MKTKNILLTTITSILFALSINFGFAYNLDKTYSFGYNEGSSAQTINDYILLHEVGVDNSPAINNAIYMKREWYSNGAYTSHIVGDGGKVYQVGEPGYVQWGAGDYMNQRSPVQIELARTWDKSTFEKDYKAYIDLIRDSAKQFNIPLELDGSGRGIKTHKWVTDNIWGDHTDPYGYLSRWGVSKQKLANDIKYGIGSVDKSNTSKPNKPKPQGQVFYNERAMFVSQNTINVRTQPNTKGTVTGQLQPGDKIIYDSYTIADGYVWVKYQSWNGIRYFAVRPVNQNAYGYFVDI